MSVDDVLFGSDPNDESPIQDIHAPTDSSSDGDNSAAYDGHITDAVEVPPPGGG